MSTSDITFTALPSFEISTGLCFFTRQKIVFFFKENERAEPVFVWKRKMQG